MSSDDIEMNTALQHSKDDEDDSQGQDEDMDDLFGHDMEGEQRPAPASPTSSGPESERLTSPERERRRALEYEEEEEPPPEIAVEVKEAQVKFPNLPVPKSSDGDNWVIRMPNFVNVDTKPFHPDTYIGPEEDDELQGDGVREKSMSIKLKVENTLRWRWGKDESGEDKKRESNSRVIRWSDGTLSLRLGKEYFDITQSIDSSAGVSRSTLGGASSQSQHSTHTPAAIPSVTGSKSEGLTYLVAQHKRSQVLQSEAVITGYMTLRPTGMQSETHRMLVRAVGQKHNKIARLRIAPEPTVDPEREKMELMKQSARKSKSRRPLAYDEEPLGGRGERKKRSRAQRSMDRGDIYTDDEDEGGLYAGEDEDEDDDMGLGASPRKQKRKAGKSDEAGEDYQADDFVVPDESDEEGGGNGRSKKRPRDDASEDDLERMEAKLEKQAAEKKGRGGNTKKPKPKDEDETEDEDNGAMDVESEEEEEDFKVRRVTGKRAIAFEEEEED